MITALYAPIRHYLGIDFRKKWVYIIDVRQTTRALEPKAYYLLIREEGKGGTETEGDFRSGQD